MRQWLVALVAVGVLALPPVTVQAAVTFVDSDYISAAAGVGGTTLTRTVTAMAGDAICACAVSEGGDLSATISDDDTSSYTPLTRTLVDTLAIRMACAVNVTATGGDVVVTANWGVSTYRGLFVQVFRGVATAAAIEDSDSGTAFSAAPATPALSLTGTGIVTGCLGQQAAQMITPVSPLVHDQEDETWTSVSGAMSYGPYSGAGVTPTWMLAGNANWAAHAFALKEAVVVSSTKRCLIIGVGQC